MRQSNGSILYQPPKRLTYAPPVMPGPAPGIPTGTGIPKVVVTRCNGARGDGRDKPGHDGLGVRQSLGRW